MKKSAFFSVVAVCAVLLSSCASLNISHAESDSQKTHSEGWSESNLRHISEALIQDCVNSTGVRNYIQQSGENPVVLLGPVQNQTSGSVDTAKISRSFKTAIINNGEMKLSSAVQTAAPANADFYTALELLKENAAKSDADFILHGYVQQSNNATFIDMEIIEVQSDNILWQGRLPL